jgi:hypothetical protein
VRSRYGADDLLLLMEKAVQKYINTPKLQGLLLWADEVTAGSEGNYKGVGKRAVAIGNSYAFDIANTIANDIAIAIAYAIGIAIFNDIANSYAFDIAIALFNFNFNFNDSAIAIAYAEELERLKIFKDVNWTELINQLKVLETQIPSDNEPEEVHERFINQFVQTWQNALHLDRELVNLSEEEAEALSNYLYANRLILQCKEAAVWVSAKTWENIESRMLMVPIK